MCRGAKCQKSVVSGKGLTEYIVGGARFNEKGGVNVARGAEGTDMGRGKNKWGSFSLCLIIKYLALIYITTSDSVLRVGTLFRPDYTQF